MEKIQRRQFFDLVWQCKELTLFCEWLNSCQPDLRFTHHQSNTQLDYLDVTVKVSENQLCITLFRKPTERNTCVQYSSSLPRAIKNGLPYGAFLHIRHNCKLK